MNRIWIFLFMFFVSLVNNVSAQSITFDNVPPLTSGGNTAGGVCFNFTTSQDIIIEHLRCNLSNNTNTATIWYNPNKINGQPTINAANGWVNLGSVSMTGAATASSNIVSTIPLLLNLNVQANDTIGLAIQWTGSNYPTTNVNIPTFTDGTVTMIADSTCAFTFNSGMSTFYNPRQINGGVIYRMARKYSNDGAVSRLVTPSLPTCGGNTPVVAAIRNAGNNVINSISVNWSIDNVLQTPITVTSPLDTANGTGVNERDITLGNMNITGPTVLKIWTSNVNNAVDSNAANDTITVNIDPAMSGNYTINSAVATGGTNFQTISAFTTALETRGICGPVVATVVAGSGPYTGKVVLKDINGASATNTIRILGNGATVNVATTSTAGSKEMLLLDKASYFTIDSFNFVSTSTSAGWGALITNNSQYDSIIRCKFDLSAVTATASASNSGIMIAGSNSTATTSGLAGNHIYIGSNHILGANGTGGCYYGVVVAAGGNHNNIIEKNRIENYFYYGVYVSGAENLQVLNNEIVRPNKSASIGIHNAIYLTGACAGTVVDGNRIHSNGVLTATGWSSFYGIRSLADGTAARPVLISNNALYNFMGTSLWLIYINGAEQNKIFNNTIEFNVNTNSNVANYGIYFTGTNTGSEVYNNIISYSGGGTGVKYGLYYSTTTAGPAISEMNNIYMGSANAGTQNYAYYGTAYATRALFRAAFPALEINSPEVNPQYTSLATGDLTPLNQALINVGLPTAPFVTRDINGRLRPQNPTLGAFEKEPTNFNDLAAYAFTQPKEPFCAGAQDVYVVVQNAGINTINNFNIGWSINNVNQTPTIINSTLVPVNVQGTSIDTFLVGTTNITGPITLKAWTYAPNGGNDTFNINDTVEINVAPSIFEIKAAQDTICSGGDAILTISGSNNAQINNGDVAWYTSANGINWTLVPNENDTIYAPTNLNAAMYFKAVYIGNGSNCETDPLTIFTTDVNITSIKNDTICTNDTAYLVVTGNPGNEIKWFADSTSTTPIHTGDTLELNGLMNTTRYWAQSTLSGGGVTSVGPANPNAVGTGASVTGSSYEMYFTVHTATTLKTVDVFATATNSTGSVSILNRANQLVGTYGYTLPATTGITVPVTVQINQALQPGDYIMKMTTTSPSLYRNSTGASYPYTSPAISITGNSFGAAYYYYFYNWQYESGCASPKVPVTAYVSTTPSVDLGSDIEGCFNEGELLTIDAGNPGAMYIWDNNYNGRIRVVDQSGTYHVRVYNEFGCEDFDTIHVVMKYKPASNLGDDTVVCIDQPVILDAGNSGIQYYWNTGQSTPQITASDSGEYIVFITGNNGCVTTDTIQVNYNGYAATFDGIQIRNIGPRKFQFNTINPQYVIGYQWDFGDGSPLVFAQSPIHEYDANGNYLVKCYVTSSCGGSYDTMTVHIYSMSTNELASENVVKLYPNPTANYLTVSVNHPNVTIQKITIVNVLGQKLETIEVKNTPSTIDLEVAKYPAGSYQLLIETNNGIVVEKFIKSH